MPYWFQNHLLTCKSVQCTLHAVYCTVNSAHCTLHAVYCTLNTAHYTLHTVHCTIYNAQSTLHTIYCTLYTVHCTLYTVQCTLYTKHCTLQCAVHCTELHFLVPNVYNRFGQCNVSIVFRVYSAVQYSVHWKVCCLYYIVNTVQITLHSMNCTKVYLVAQCTVEGLLLCHSPVILQQLDEAERKQVTHSPDNWQGTGKRCRKFHLPLLGRIKEETRKELGTNSKWNRKELGRKWEKKIGMI